MAIDVLRNLDGKTARKLGYLFLFFFLIIAAFWTLKPMRTSGVLKAFGPDYYPLFKQGIILFIPLFMGLFTSMTCYLSREQMVYFFVSLFAGLSVVFWGLFQWHDLSWVRVAFFFFVDAYITLMVVLFFSYLSDIFYPDDAKKYYGIIGLGGLLGGIAGSAVSGWASVALGHHIVLATLGFLLPICLIVHRLRPLVPAPDTATVCPPEGKSPAKRFTEGMVLVFRSRYLLAIVLIVGIYEMVSTTIDYQFNALSAEIYRDQNQLAAFQGKVFFVASVGSLLIQLFLTGWLLQRKGVAAALLILPVLLLAGSGAFFLFPLLPVITLACGGDAAFSYSINQVSKEVLYVPLDSVARFKSKAFIDMFVQRGAKAVAAGFLMLYTLVLSQHGFTHRFLMVVNIVAAVVWVGAVLYVSRAFNEAVARKAQGGSSEAQRAAS